ncbi:hypothetical protein PAEPH01_1207 [Pancytospora epiphaga]|nr:hypothetical protein PAEPH01_1207 [Pancytospora epiphaga]
MMCFELRVRIFGFMLSIIARREVSIGNGSDRGEKIVYEMLLGNGMPSLLYVLCFDSFSRGFNRLQSKVLLRTDHEMCSTNYLLLIDSLKQLIIINYC